MTLTFVFAAGWPNKLDVPPNPDCAAGRLREDANMVGAGSESRSMRDEGFCRRCLGESKTSAARGEKRRRMRRTDSRG